MTGTPIPQSASSVAQRVEAAVARNFERDLESLIRLISIPSVSAEGYERGGLGRSADAVRGEFLKAGLGDVQTIELSGAPPYVVARYAERPDAPTVLLYAHHDVQPPGDLADWTSDPFDATIRHGRLFGRGAADDKAGVVVHLAAIGAWLQTEGALPINVTVLIDGEEETGSKHLPELLARHRDKLGADFVLVADGMHWQRGTPSLTHSLRGVASYAITLRALERPLHSGYFGGPTPDAVTAMCVLIASLVDDHGALVVPGIDITVPMPGESVLLRPSLAESELRELAGFRPGVKLIGDPRREVTSRLWESASHTVIGFDAPPVKGASNTIQPSCRARISVRLPPECDPVAASAALADHLRRHTPWGLECDLVPVSVQPGWRGKPDGQLSRAAARAFERAYGRSCVSVGLGGTVPFVRPFLDALGGPDCLITAIGDPDCAAHGPNESVALDDFASARAGEALLLAELADFAAPSSRHNNKTEENH